MLWLSIKMEKGRTLQMAYTGKVICWIHNKSLEVNLKARESYWH